MNDIVAPIIRRAILDLLYEQGRGENHDTIANILRSRGHQVGRGDVKAQLVWLEEQGLVRTETLSVFLVATLTENGRDAAEDGLRVEGVSRFKTGE